MKIFTNWGAKRKARKATKAKRKQEKAKFAEIDPTKNAEKVLSDTKEKIKVKKPKPPRDKFSQRVEEFPIKMVKEVNKIKWSTKENLTKKYLEVLIFIILFAAFFALVDFGFQALFSLIKVV